jgi:hypothetical protein
LTDKITCHKADSQKVESTYFTKFNYLLALPIIWQYPKLNEYQKNTGGGILGPPAFSGILH